METMVKVAALGALTAVLCLVVREREKTLGLLLSLAGCAIALLTALQLLSPIFSVAEQLRALSGLSTAVTAPLFKVTAIGILGRVAAGVCGDAGGRALGRGVGVSGSILAQYAALPLVSAVLELLEDMLGG